MGAALCGIVAGATPAFAQGSTQPAPGWSVTLTPYMWAAGVSGTVELPRQSRDFSADFGDIFDDLKFAVMGSAELRSGRFGLLIDMVYMDIEQGVSTPRGVVFRGGEARLTATEFAAVGLYRAVEQPSFTLDAGAGARAWWFDTKLTLNQGLGGPRSDSASPTWLDPILAMRAQFRLSESLSIVAYGDIGGFDLGSRLTWQALGAIEWRFAQNMSAQLGYRYLYIDYAKKDVSLDVGFGGPLLGVSFRF